MAEFGVSSMLDVEVSKASLKAARKTIETELGDLTVSVDANTPSSQLGSAGNRDIVGREQAMSRQLLTGQSQTLNTVSDQFGENLELNRERNDLLRELLEATDEGNFTSARSGGAAGGGGILLGGLALGGGILSGLTNFKFDPVELDVPDIPPLQPPEIPPIGVNAPSSIPLDVPDLPELTIKKPGWLPLQVGQPSPSPQPNEEPLPAPQPDEGPSPAPGPSGTPDPTFPPYGSVTRRRPSPLGEPSPAPSPAPSGIGLPKIGLPEIGLGIGSALGIRELSKIKLPFGGGTTGSPSIGFPAPSQLFAQQAENAQNRDPNNRNWLDKQLVKVWNDMSVTGGGSTVAAAAPMQAAMESNVGNQAQERRQRQDGGTLEYSPTFNLPVSDLKRAYQRDMRKLEQKVDELDRAFKNR